MTSQVVIMVKYGEIALKGLNRKQFEEQLMHNLAWQMRDIPDTRIFRRYGRLCIETVETQKALKAAARTFGVVGVSLAKKVPAQLEAIYRAGIEVMNEVLAGAEGGTGSGRHIAAQGNKEAKISFKVETVRADKNFPVPSPEVSRLLGAKLLASFPTLVVDVHQPDILLEVEIREDGAYLYHGTLAGPGGLPVGTGGRALLLLSGGIDSPVAGWLVMRRGVKPSIVHFHTEPFTSERARRKVIDLSGILAAYGGELTVYMVRFTEVMGVLSREVPDKMLITIMRRMMLRVAERLAQSAGIPALVTGESIGQVASQTLESMAAINAVTHMPVLRPLVTADKTNIMTLARAIGTYDISIEPYEDCCTIYVPRHPQTKPHLPKIEAAEAGLDIEKLVAMALERMEELTVKPYATAALYEGGPLPGL